MFKLVAAKNIFPDTTVDTHVYITQLDNEHSFGFDVNRAVQCGF